MNSLNFGVPTEPEASKLPKNLVLGRDENIHIRLTGSTPLNDVRSYICSSLHGDFETLKCQSVGHSDAPTISGHDLDMVKTWQRFFGKYRN